MGFEPVTSPLNPVEVLNFFQVSLRNCINCVHCDDHFFIFRKQCVTAWKNGNRRFAASHALATAMLDSKGPTWTRQTKGLKCIT